MSCLTEALAEDIVPASSSPPTASMAELESRMQVLTFERNQARALMQTAIAGRDVAFVAKNVAIADRDAHRAYADELVAQARRVLESQERTVHMATSLLDRIAEYRLRTGPQTPEAINYLEFLASLTSNL